MSVLLGFMEERKGGECVHEAQFILLVPGPELWLGNLVLTVAPCFSQNTMKWVNVQLLFYSDQSLTRRNQTEMQEDTQEGRKGTMTKPRGFHLQTWDNICNAAKTWHFTCCHVFSSRLVHLQPRLNQHLRMCIVVALQANICPGMDKDPSSSCIEKGEVQKETNCCTGAEQGGSGLVHPYTVCSQSRTPADNPCG